VEATKGEFARLDSIGEKDEEEEDPVVAANDGRIPCSKWSPSFDGCSWLHVILGKIRYKPKTTRRTPPKTTFLFRHFQAFSLFFAVALAVALVDADSS
jgi:hypothetical protein